MKGGYLGAFAAITGNEVSNALKVTVFRVSLIAQWNRQD